MSLLRLDDSWSRFVSGHFRQAQDLLLVWRRRLWRRTWLRKRRLWDLRHRRQHLIHIVGFESWLAWSVNLMWNVAMGRLVICNLLVHLW